MKRALAIAFLSVALVATADAPKSEEPTREQVMAAFVEAMRRLQAAGEAIQERDVEIAKLRERINVGMGCT